MTQTSAGRRRKAHQARQRRVILTGLVLLLALIAVLLLTLYPKEEERAAPELRERTESAAPLPELPAGWVWAEPFEPALTEGTLALVNLEHSFDPALAQTVSVYAQKTGSYFVKDTDLSVTPETMDALNRWLDAFAAETGRTDVNIVAGWRSYDEQRQLYQNAVDTRGQEYADAYLALPGCSEHHTGLAVDLDTYDPSDGSSGGFDGEGVYARAVARAWEFGFIQRYPPEKREITGIAYEAWHFRYVGLPHSYVMATRELCLEEYIDLLRAHPFFGEHLCVSCLGVDYELYFCPAEQLVVPGSGSYTVCGNNADGYIVTVITL